MADICQSFRHSIDASHIVPSKGFSNFWQGVLSKKPKKKERLTTSKLVKFQSDESLSSVKSLATTLRKLRWVTETFHARFPAYFWPTPKHPATREKKRPCGIEPEYVLNHILFNIQHIILKLGTLFYHAKAFLNTAEIKWNFFVAGWEMVH